MSIAPDLFDLIEDLVMCHSPSGVEDEVDVLLRERFEALGLAVELDPSGNLITKIPGTGGGRLAITAHKDEIGAIVMSVQDEGRIKVRRLGGSFPWAYGEGIVDILGDTRVVNGVLSFGSRHVSHASPQKAQHETAALRWEDAWVETKLSKEALAAAGVRPGSRMVIGKHRKKPFRLHEHIASYTLDNKASLAILLELARRVKAPRPDLFLIASAKEEVGAIGALYFTQRNEIDALISLEVAPIAPEYTIVDGVSPVLLAEDGLSFYDDQLNGIVQRSAEKRKIPLQIAVVNNFGSDASNAMKQGHVARGACLGFPTQNTHGFEIAHLGAIENCIQVLEALCLESFT
jgi:putative aminopeptidase FrvX